jgi:hypothetical protein
MNADSSSPRSVTHLVEEHISVRISSSHVAVGAIAAALAFTSLQPLAGESRVVRSVPTFTVNIFAQGTSSLYNPDAVVVTSTNVFVAYQNNSDTVKGVPSYIVKYDRSGNMLGQVPLIGRCDGMRLNPYTNQLWVLLNNDGLNGKPARQPRLYTVDPSTLVATLYNFPPVQPHGGGYDDLAFANGRAFISASAPVLNSHGINDKPAIVEVRLDGSNAHIKPVVYGNTYGFDIPTHTFGQLNITDPDSMMIDSRGGVVLSSEGDAQLIFVRHIGERSQSVARLPAGTQLDKSAWTSGTSGTLFVADSGMNVIYAIQASFDSGTIFSEAGSGAPVQGFIGALDPKTGILTPLLTARDGLIDPTTLVFVPAGM